MRWFHRHRNQQEIPESLESLDLEQLLKEGLRDQPAARSALVQLDQERKNLERQRKAVDSQTKQLTSGKVKQIARSNSRNLEIGANMLADAMRDANSAVEAVRGEQLAAIDQRMQAIERTRKQLDAYLRRWG